MVKVISTCVVKHLIYSYCYNKVPFLYLNHFVTFTPSRSNSFDMSVVESAMSTPVSDLMPTGRVVVHGGNGQDHVFDVVSVESGPIKPNCGYRHGGARLRCGKTNCTYILRKKKVYVCLYLFRK